MFFAESKGKYGLKRRTLGTVAPKKPMPPVPFAREAALRSLTLSRAWAVKPAPVLFINSALYGRRHLGMISLPKKPMPPVPFAREAPLPTSVRLLHRHWGMISLPKKPMPPVPFAREAALPTIVRLSQSLMSVVTHGQEGSSSTPIILLRRTALLSPTLVSGRSAMRA